MDAAVTAPKLMMQKATDGKWREFTCDTAQSGVERDRYEKKYTDAFGDHPTGQL